jgi:hypothetical protein
VSYIGQQPVVGRYIKIDQISGGFNGTASGFTLNAGGQGVLPGTARNLMLSLGGVIQEPEVDFTISGSGITFTTPPVAGTTFFCVVFGDMQAIGQPSDGTVIPASIATSGVFTFPDSVNVNGSGTVSGTTANFATGNFSSQLSGNTITGTTGAFTSITGVTGVFTQLSGQTFIASGTVSGTTANFATGNFSSQLSGNTITGTTGAFTRITGVTGVFTQLSGQTFIASGNVTVISGSGDVRPYGLYSFPATTGTSGFVLSTNANGTTAWISGGGGGSSLTGKTNSATPFETSLGFEAGLVNTGINNTFIGYQAGKANTTGANNVAVGYRALDVNTTGDSNVAIGSESLGSNTTGANNIAIGQQVLVANTGGVSNVALGTSALDVNTTGNNNVAIGSNALGANTTGNNNVAIGSSALRVNTTGSSNIAVGWQALDANTTGTNNTAVGEEALGSLTFGTENTAVSNSAMPTLTTGARNIGVGRRAGNSLTTSTDCVFIGYQAGQSTTTGLNNVAIGTNALNANTVAGRSTGVGRDALSAITIGGFNTALGYFAGSNLTTGEYNTCIGHNALASTATVVGEFTLGDANVTNLRCADTTISTLSDARDKTNIADLPYGINFIQALRPVQFDWAARDGSRQGRKDFGFIAQELDQVEQSFGCQAYTRLVHKDNPESWEADPIKTYPILVKAVQELSERLVILENKVK